MLKKLLLITVFAFSAYSFAIELHSPDAIYFFDDSTGSISAIHRKKDNKKVVTKVNNIYQLMAKSGDITASDEHDRIIRKKIDGNTVYIECSNPRLPDFRIGKHYSIVNGSLRRMLTFFNDSPEKKFIIPFTESHFTDSFRKKSYYFGAGYLGPFIPAPQVKSPTRVDTFVQSSKGMLLINTAEPRLGNYANVRVKINDTVVFPWWQSTIGRYREMDDRLYYLPDGWRMALGCLDMEANNGKISYTDIVSFFYGDLVDFFQNIIVKDPDFSAALKKIPPVLEDAQDIFASPQWGHEPYLRYLSEMSDEGTILYRSLISADWGDYRWKDGFNSRGGGFITGEEVKAYVKNIHDISPRIKMSLYSILIGADQHSPVFKEHPGWFRQYNRSGDIDSFFPGLFNNFQSMFNIPECRNFMADTLAEMSEFTGTGFIYTDEAQQQNTINWQTMQLVRDDHCNLLWQRLRSNAAKQNKMLFFNGSANPYADINYMEGSPRQMNPVFWREFSGIALGLELASLMRPDSRLALLYWRDDLHYMSLCLALGWIPVPNPGVGDSLPKMRAVYETGKTLPISAVYSPDWKKDYTTNINSFAVRRRNSSDVLISFINRGKRRTDLDVTLDLSTLGFKKNERINLWAVDTVSNNVANDYALSDKESKYNYENFKWNDRTITAVQLLYSGNADGKWQHSFKKMKYKGMIQLIITSSPAGIFSCNNLVQNYFYTRKKSVHLDGSKVFSKIANAELIFADTDNIFTKIKANGKDLAIRNIDLGGKIFQLVSIPKGESTLSWEITPRKKIESPEKINAFLSGNKISITTKPAVSPDTLFVAEQKGIIRSCGRSPLTIPEKHQNGTYTIRIAGNASNSAEVVLSKGKSSSVKHIPYAQTPDKIRFSPEKTNKNGVNITKSATLISRHKKLRNLQNNLDSCIVKADAQNLHLSAGTTRKEDTLDINHYAGFEINGADNLQLKLSNTFYKAFAVYNKHVYSSIPKRDFSGIVVDYRVNNNYTKRVCFSIGLGSSALQNQYPLWGCNKVQDEHITLGLLTDEPETIFSLDLKKHAPENWDGTVFFSIGNNHINPNRRLDVEILSANAPEKIPFLDGFNLTGRGKVQKKTPAPLELPRVKKRPLSWNKITPSEWKSWAKINSLLPYPGDEAPMENTQCFIAYDSDFIYIAVEASEKLRLPLAKQAMPYNNDCVEFYFQNTKKEIVQVVIDAAGRVFSLPQNIAKELHVVSSVKKGSGYTIFAAVPWKILQVKEIIPGMVLPFNLTRVRIDPNAEKSSWGPVRKVFGFRDVQNFGSLISGALAEGMGRYEEFFVPEK